MKDERVSVTTSDGTMSLYVARPENEAKGAVVVIQEAFGVTTHIENVCKKLAVDGWVGVAPAIFHRFEPQIVSYDDMDGAMAAIGKVDAEGLRMDLEASFDWLNSQGFADGHIGIVGFCMGGAVALYANTLRTIGAAITYYGGGVVQGRFGLSPLLQLAPEMKSPWLGQFGDLDTGIPPEQVEELRTAAATLPFDTEIIRYPEAGHAFNCDDRPKSFNAKAAAAGWQATLDWFNKHIR